MKTHMKLKFSKLALTLLALPTVAHSESASSWRVSGDIDGYSQNSVQICLLKSGIDEQSAWESLAGDSARSDCQELIVFDKQSNLIHLAFPGAINAPTYFCSKKVQVSGRHPCNSVFFAGSANEPDRRTLDRANLKKALIESGGMTMADQLIAAAREVEHASYRNEFEAAIRSNRIDLMTSFIDRYASNDPDQLVPKARMALDKKNKREAIAAAGTLQKQALEAEKRTAKEAEDRKLRAGQEAEAKRRRALTQLDLE